MGVHYLGKCGCCQRLIKSRESNYCKDCGELMAYFLKLEREENDRAADH